MMRFFRIFIVFLFVCCVAFSVYVYFSNKADYSAPEIKCSVETVSVSVDDTEEHLLSFVTATDEKDGDLTDKIIVESISPFISSNSAKITYSVCDSENNVSKLEKDIVFSDYEPPVFKFNKQHVYYVGATKVDLLTGVTASDSLDGDISARIVVAESNIDLSQPGIYPVTYRVTTSKGITSEISINTYVYSSRLADSIELKSYLVYTDVNKNIIPEDFIENIPEKYIDNKDRTYEYTFDIVDDVDYSKPGIHYITYRITRTNRYNDPEDPVVVAESYLAVAVRGDNR